MVVDMSISSFLEHVIIKLGGNIMPVTINGVDQEIVEIRRLRDMVKASKKFRWRLLAIIVAIASVISATFQVLSYFFRYS